MAIRNSVKALIIEENKILFTKNLSNKEGDKGEIFYILPGGGQNNEETFCEALKRECKEELGARIKVDKIALVREYIGKNHEFAEQDKKVHQIEFMFLCRLLSPVNLSLATNMDSEQFDIEWIELSELKEANIYPKVLKRVIDINGKIQSPVYIGDMN